MLHRFYAEVCCDGVVAGYVAYYVKLFGDGCHEGGDASSCIEIGFWNIDFNKDLSGAVFKSFGAWSWKKS